MRCVCLAAHKLVTVVCDVEHCSQLGRSTSIRLYLSPSVVPYYSSAAVVVLTVHSGKGRLGQLLQQQQQHLKAY